MASSGSFAADVAAAAKGLSLTLAEDTVEDGESEEENISPEGSDNEEQAAPHECAGGGGERGGGPWRLCTGCLPGDVSYAGYLTHRLSYKG